MWAIRQARIPVEEVKTTIEAWRAVLPVQAADDGDLLAALDALQGVTFINPFKRANDQLIDEILSPS